MTNKNSVQELLILKETLRIEKDMLEKRGKKYTRLFRKFSKLWAAYFKRQAQEFIDYVDNNPQLEVRIKKDADDDFEQENETQLMELYVLGMESQEMEIQSKMQIGYSFDIQNEGAMKYAKKRAGTLIKGVNETTQKEVSSLITRAFEEGMSLKEVKQEIYTKFAEYSEYRSGLIAVMETGNAYEEGKKEQFDHYADKFGVTGWKRSYIVDETARPSHQENAAAGWIRATELFPGTLTDHAPHGFNCRCTVTYSLINPDETSFLDDLANTQ